MRKKKIAGIFAVTMSAATVTGCAQNGYSPYAGYDYAPQGYAGSEPVFVEPDYGTPIIVIERDGFPFYRLFHNGREMFIPYGGRDEFRGQDPRRQYQEEMRRRAQEQPYRRQQPFHPQEQFRQPAPRPQPQPQPQSRAPQPATQPQPGRPQAAPANNGHPGQPHCRPGEHC